MLCTHHTPTSARQEPEEMLLRQLYGTCQHVKTYKIGLMSVMEGGYWKLKFVGELRKFSLMSSMSWLDIVAHYLHGQYRLSLRFRSSGRAPDVDLNWTHMHK